MTNGKSIALGLGASLLFACGPNGGSGDGSHELTGTAAIAITNAPPDGTCIQVTAVGYRTVMQSFTVASGASTVLPMKGLPLGSVAFSANAFAGACAMVNPMTVPNWISDPVPANVAVAPPVSVTIEMRRNGNASVSVDFPNEPDGSAQDAGGSSCGPGSGQGPVDQSQLLSDGDFVVSAQQVVGQSFIVGRSGVLTGIEVGTDACNGIDPMAIMQLTLLSGGTNLGTAGLGANAIPAGGCGSDPLSATMIGPGFFDLSALCVPVMAGQALTFELTILEPTMPSCNATTHTCSGGIIGATCTTDSQCAYTPRVGLQDGNPYASGTAIVNGSAQSTFDLSFKTFVR
jgi:hypothetical protein